MKKTTAILSLILILALCMTLAACGDKASDSKEKATEAVTEKPTEAPTDPPEPGVAVGDTFTYVDFPITVKEINEGTEDISDDSKQPEGKFVTIIFDADMKQGNQPSYTVESKVFKIDGKEAVDAYMRFGTNEEGFNTFIAVFDVDKDADLNDLHLTVGT